MTRARCVVSAASRRNVLMDMCSYSYSYSTIINVLALDHQVGIGIPGIVEHTLMGFCRAASSVRKYCLYPDAAACRF